jgi:DNA-binding GntR family transcriptional regulator
MERIDPLGNPEYAYVQAANAIAARIEAGEITHRLPGERTLARELGGAYQTLRHSMEVLRDRGLIVTRQGRGTFVAPMTRCDSC